MASQLEKTYQCLNCKANIKLARKDDNTGWNKFNLDGSSHIHPPTRKQQASPTNESRPQSSQQPQMDKQTQALILLKQAIKLLEQEQQQAQQLPRSSYS